MSVCLLHSKPNSLAHLDEVLRPRCNHRVATQVKTAHHSPTKFFSPYQKTPIQTQLAHKKKKSLLLPLQKPQYALTVKPSVLYFDHDQKLFHRWSNKQWFTITVVPAVPHLRR